MSQFRTSEQSLFWQYFCKHLNSIQGHRQKRMKHATMKLWKYSSIITRSKTKNKEEFNISWIYHLSLMLRNCLFYKGDHAYKTNQKHTYIGLPINKQLHRMFFFPKFSGKYLQLCFTLDFTKYCYCCRFLGNSKQC